MELRILETLLRFASVDYFTLRGLVLAGGYSIAAEKEFQLTLSQMKDRGAVVAPVGIFGRLSILALPVFVPCQEVLQDLPAMPA